MELLHRINCQRFDKTCNNIAIIVSLLAFMNIKLNWDGVGILTSVVCAIHCALLPVIIPTLPLFGVNIIHNSIFEWSMIVLAFFVGSYALYHGYMKHHRSWIPAGIFMVGFVFLVTKQFLPNHEYAFLVVAVLFIITAHYINYRYCHRSKCASPHHKH